MEPEWETASLEPAQIKKGGREMKKLLVLLVGFTGLVFLAGCATSIPKTGFLGEYAEKMQPGPEGAAKMRWLKPGVNFGKYNKFMVDYVIFALSPDSDYKGINGEQMKELGDSASKAVLDAIKEKYPVVAEPGPDVCRLRFAIVDLKQSYPVLSGITSVLPIGLGISIIKKGATMPLNTGGSGWLILQKMSKGGNNAAQWIQDSRGMLDSLFSVE
jgi:hypothetical protein